MIHQTEIEKAVYKGSSTKVVQLQAIAPDKISLWGSAYFWQEVCRKCGVPSKKGCRCQLWHPSRTQYFLRSTTPFRIGTLDLTKGVFHRRKIPLYKFAQTAESRELYAVELCPWVDESGKVAVFNSEEAALDIETHSHVQIYWMPALRRPASRLMDNIRHSGIHYVNHPRSKQARILRVGIFTNIKEFPLVPLFSFVGSLFVLNTQAIAERAWVLKQTRLRFT